MANPDRLTGLDASFLALEKGGAHMHVGSVLVFDGEAPPYDELRRADREPPAPGPPLPPEARVPAARAGAPGVGRRPALQRRLPRPPHRAAGARRRAASCGSSPAACSPSARPLQAAVGDLARRPRRRGPLRARLQDAPRAGRRHLRRRHHDRAVRPRARPARARARPGAGTRGPEPSGSGAVRRRGDRARVGRRSTPRAPRPARSPTPREAAGSAAHASPGSRRWPPPGWAARPRARSTRASARTGASPGWRPTSSRFKAIKGALGGTVNDVVLDGRGRRAARAPDAPRARPRGAVELKAMVPVSVRAEDERGDARQPGGRDLRAAAGRPRGPARALPGRPRGARRPEGVGAGDRRRDADAARRLRGARRCSTRPRGCRRASGSSTSPSPTCPARSSRSTCSAAGCARSTRRCRWC